ncbi:MAG: DUF3048 domain-containing protein [Acidimicrobiaceae bacterium]|nr:DUF3048 domain-containing protein [Acidimicrobiaceae bacterium]
MRKLLSLVVAVLVIGVALVVAWPHLRGGSGPTVTTTSTTVHHSPVAPLSGLADPSGVSLTRPALSIKIENTPEALPQWGVDQADVVYEEIVNGGITRLLAIFNSHAPSKVGPVRSVRPTDTQILWPLGGIFAYSGGAAYAIASISTVPSLKLIDESSAGAAMFRDPTRYAPHNLYAVAPSLFAFPAKPTPPPPLFTYRQGALTLASSVVKSFVVPFPSIYPVTWTWDTTTLSWDRTLFASPDVTGTNVRESPKNVIVMWVNYVNGIGTMSSYADLQGSGPAAIFTDGREVHAQWSRGPLKSDVVQYRTASGARVALSPGQTWVELLNTGALLSVTK